MHVLLTICAHVICSRVFTILYMSVCIDWLIHHMSNLLKGSEAKYQVNVPTAILVHKPGATATARQIGGEAGVLIRQQLSHSSETDM